MTDIDICNLALKHVGQRERIAAFTDDSAAADDCGLLYPLARDGLLTRAQWRFATRQAGLLLWNLGLPVGPWSSTYNYATGAVVNYAGQDYISRASANLGNVPIAPGSGADTDDWWEPGDGPQYLPGWQNIYTPPVDLLAPQYVFSGARPGQPALATTDYLAFGAAYNAQLPLINGEVPGVPFEYQSGFIYCDLADAQLVYTKATTDPTADAWPALFITALGWQLAADLAPSLAKRGSMAKELADTAEAWVLKALAAESNNETPDPRPDSSFVSVRV